MINETSNKDKKIPDYSELTSLAVIKWTFKTETPLLIRSTHNASWRQSPIGNDGKPIGKARGSECQFRMIPRDKSDREDDKKFSQVTLPYMTLFLENNEVKPVYTIPASAIRGALRNWTIRHLVKEKYWDAFIQKKKEEADENYKKKQENALKDPGWQLVFSLFGQALDTSKEDSDKKQEDKEKSNKKEPKGYKGRLQIEVGKLSGGTKEPGACGKWTPDSVYDPSNAIRHIKMRNPLDRVTHASVSGGLHTFVEFGRNMEFEVTFTIREPERVHMALMALWKREIEYGMIRFGALSSVGRGRVSIVNEDEKEYVVKKTADSSEENNKEDLLEDLLRRENITLEFDEEAKKVLREALGIKEEKNVTST